MLKKSYYLFVAVCVSLIALSDCTARNRRKRRVKKEVVQTTVDCTLHVDGVECQFCAQSVVDMLNVLPGVTRAEYHASDDTYEDGHATFVFDTGVGTIAREQLIANLKKEGFELVSLSPELSSTAQTPNQ